MSHGFSGQFHTLLEHALALFAMLFVHETSDASYQVKRHSILIWACGRDLRQHISFHWHMRVTGLIKVSVNGSQNHQLMKDQSTLCRTVCCSDLISISYLTSMVSQVILMYVFHLLKSCSS